MKQVKADKVKADATRALLTCRCSHQQTEHLHSIKDGMVVGRWLMCLADGCSCQAFLSCLTARELVIIHQTMDDKVAASQLAAVMQNQPPKPVTPVSQFPVSKPPKYDRKARRSKERVKSADNAGVSGLYHNTGTRKPNGKYAWEEL